MRIEIFKNYQQVHIWTGILSGLLLYICFVAGAFTMFKAPLNQWALQDEQRLPAISYAQYDGLIQQVLATHPEAASKMTVNLPNAVSQHAPVSWTVEDPTTHAVTTWQASLNNNDELLVQSTHLSAIGDFLDDLHRTGGIPGGGDHDAYGILVMGLVAALYFIAIVSGLIIFLPTWFKDLFTLRKGKNSKRFWVDFHNVLGITALPFHIVIAVTTVVFAYHDILYGAMQQWVYKDTSMFTRAAPTEIDRDFSKLLPVTALDQAIKVLEPEFEPAVLEFAALGTSGARVMIGGKLAGQWIRGPEYAYWVSDPYTAASRYSAMLPSVSGATGKVVNGFFTLHFGGFGGALVHWIYFGLGMSGALLFLTGNIIWIEARRKKHKSDESVVQKHSVKIMARLTIGVALGMLIGVACALLAVKGLPHHALDIIFWQQVAYYSGFLLSVGFTFVQRPIKAAKQLLTLLCVLIVALITLTLLNLDRGFNFSIDLSFCFVACLLLIGLVATLFHLHKREEFFPSDNVWS
ncbi:PepSY-associated TM helix domain-containing protein [Paraglaciecola sp.]|uniref:PepSY-associated TM helix domain-containing protein n=1 Tax=Paraglaciecola sp. TaxID=1920173 RepID=UPI0030F4843B